MAARFASPDAIPIQLRRLFGRDRRFDTSRATSADGAPTLPLQPAAAASPGPTPHLLNAYIASSFEVALQAEALAAGAERLDLAPVDLAAVLSETVGVLKPLAATHGVSLLLDSGTQAPSQQDGDVRRLRSIVFNLTARALAAEQPGGHVRVRADASFREGCIRILSRAPDSALFRDGGGHRQDLMAAHRVLRAMGGALVLEPRRAGYQPLCLVLGATLAGAASRAA